MWLRWRDVEPDTCPADAVAALYDGRLVGLTVHGLFADRAALSAAADAACATMPHVDLDATLGLVGRGVMLAPTTPSPLGPPLDDYFAAAARDAAPLEAAFRSVDGRATIARTLGRLAGGAASTPRDYTWATLRIVAPGAEIPLHCDTYAPSPTFAYMDKATDRSTQLSWYVVTDAPRQGGALTVLRGRRDEGGPDERAAVEIPLTAGDLVLFDAGRYYHRITRVSGACARRTLGGFAGRTREGDGLLYWG
jgi:hypothetical protein